MHTIVVVDDHADIRRLLSVTLGKQYQIIEADSAASALDAIKNHSPQIVLLDVMMPGGADGLEVLSTLKSNPATRHIKVAMVSARGQTSDANAATDRGADAYFIKPFSPLQIANWVRNQLGLV